MTLQEHKEKVIAEFRSTFYEKDIDSEYGGEGYISWLREDGGSHLTDFISEKIDSQLALIVDLIPPRDSFEKHNRDAFTPMEETLAREYIDGWNSYRLELLKRLGR